MSKPPVMGPKAQGFYAGLATGIATTTAFWLVVIGIAYCFTTY